MEGRGRRTGKKERECGSEKRESKRDKGKVVVRRRRRKKEGENWQCRDGDRVVVTGSVTAQGQIETTPQTLTLSL